MKQITLVYQGCAFCGKKLKWGLAQAKAAKEAGYSLEKIPFSAETAEELMAKAREKGMTLPFFALDGVIGKSVADVLPKPKKVTRKRAKRSRKVKIAAQIKEEAASEVNVEVDNGAVSEN